ncbi:hypothetical protein CPB86DRAFT_793911 [Serendipita vermifera]|nr:hypothetical protein CPB86DRAFT_793911 [Serendipita vermifera]
MPFAPSPAEVALVGAIFALADPQKLGLVTGEQGVKVFAGAKLAPATLGDIWQLADPENNGALTRKGVAVAVRLIGWAQNGESPSAELLERVGPLANIEGLPLPAAPPTAARAPAPITPLPNQLPPLLPADKNKFLLLFNKSNPAGGLLSGEQARNMFIRSKLPLEKLNAIWTLVDTQNRGSLDAAQFVLAMYFIQGSMSNNPTIPVLPPSIPPFLWEQAGGKPPSVRSHATGESLPSPGFSSSTIGTFTPQYTGGPMSALLPQSTGDAQSRSQFSGAPIAPQITGSRLPPAVASRSPNFPLTPQLTGSPFPLARPPAVAPLPWDVTAAEKARSDGFFDTLDTAKLGYIEGSAAVPFMLLSNLPEDTLARVWDLADMRNDGRLTKDTFAVAMHLINGVLEGKDLPATLAPTLVPPSLRTQSAFNPPSQVQPTISETQRDLLSLDDELTPVIQPQTTSSPPAVPVSIQNVRPTSPPSMQRQTSPAPVVPQRNLFARDLLEDEEAEARQTKQLADNSIEIGNLRNQLNSTTNAQVSAEADRQKLEADLATSAATLSQLQTQLASAKVGYETESKLLSGLRERYQSQAAEIQTTRDELIRAESDLSALKLEKAEIGGNLLREKDDLRDLKRLVTEITEETQLIRREVEQVKKEARQHKGLLAIARKQITTAEAEKESAAKELAQAREEAEEAEKDVKQAEATLEGLRKQTSSPVANGVGNGSIHQSPSMSNSEIKTAVETKSPEISSPALPFTNTSGIASPALSSKSNNPFDRLRKSSVSSETSLQARSASPFAASNPPTTEKGLLSPVDDDDPFGFNQMSPVQVQPAVIAPDTPRQNSNIVEERAEKAMLSPVQDNLFTPSESFFTPPSSSAGNNTLDAIFADQQGFAESKFPPLAEVNSGEKSAETDLPPLQEIERGEESSSDDDEDNRPLGQVKAEKQSAAGAAGVTSATEGTESTSFNDAFGFETTQADKPAPTAASNSIFNTSGLEKSTDTPMNIMGPSTTVPGHTNGVSTGRYRSLLQRRTKRDSKLIAVPGPSAVDAFDQAMGIMPATTATEPSSKEPFKFEKTFDDTFDFGESSFSHSRNVSQEVTAPTNGVTAPSSAAFNDAFGLPSAAPTTAAMSTVANPPSSTMPLTFDDAFEVSTNGQSANPSQSTSFAIPASPTVSNEPAHAPSNQSVGHGTVPTASSIRSASPTAVRDSSSARASSPPPRAGSPKLSTSSARPRPPKESSARPASSLNPDSSSSHSKSRLSLHFPFGRSKTTKEKKEKEKKDKHAKDQNRGEPSTGGVMPPVPSMPSVPEAYLQDRLDGPDNATAGEDDDLPALRKLMEYGFSREEALGALESTGYSFQRALNKLIPASAP